MISHKNEFFFNCCFEKKKRKLPFCKLISKYLVLSDMCGQFFMDNENYSHSDLLLIKLLKLILNLILN